MAVERTLSIIKPDATRRNLTGEIVSRFEKAGLRVVAQRRTRLSRDQAEAFYAVHRERPFYAGLVKFMTEGPVVVQVLEGEGAIAKNREVMGATNPEKAAAGTIRKEFAGDIERNAVHGSRAPDTARDEIAFFLSAARRAAGDVTPPRDTRGVARRDRACRSPGHHPVRQWPAREGVSLCPRRADRPARRAPRSGPLSRTPSPPAG